ncbi:uncharacterized protein [Nicotiana tomentosiformis]|uniref:uncharacterized protein n=1 Tax=Nicotiana tomentosiformis TaxID=4098 RepID=UPI00388CB77D
MDEETTAQNFMNVARQGDLSPRQIVKVKSADTAKENWQVDFSANPFILFNYKLKKLKRALSLLNRERLHKVQSELIGYLDIEEEFWKQKSGMAWFKEGDLNTRFFHVQVNCRRRHLKLKRIQNDQDIWIEGNDDLGEEAVNFFQELFCEQTVPTTFVIINHVPSMVSMEHNEDLVKQPIKEEVKHVVFGLNGDSAGAPDGFTGKFFHSCLDIIKDDIFSMVKSLFNGHELLLFVTHTNLVLLPKKKKVNTFSEMRPISLNKFINKVFSRAIHERLVNRFPSLISDEQAGLLRKKGVKQGDPLSPTLFFLADEAISRGLNALHWNLYFCGFGLPKWSPKINHLAYADDTIIFLPSDATSLHLIMEVLSAYKVDSG